MTMSGGFTHSVSVIHGFYSMEDTFSDEVEEDWTYWTTLPGRYKTWTLDSGLDYGLEFGLNFGLDWTVAPFPRAMYQ